MPKALWPIVVLLAAWVIFTVGTLGVPDYSADEALFAVKAFEFRATLAIGGWPDLHPVNEYVGPQDTWWALLIDMLYRSSQGTVPWNPALMRLGPFLFVCFGIAQWARELAARSRRLALIGLVFAAFTPMLWVYMRVGWAPTWGLGLMALCWTESLHAERTGTARWWRWATYGGLSVWAHPNYLLGALVTLIPRWRLLSGDLRSHRAFTPLGAMIWAASLAWPLLKNVGTSSADAAMPDDWLRRLWSLIEVIDGSRPLLWQMARDAGNPTVTVTLALAAAALLCWRWRIEPATTERRRELLTALIATLILFVLARGPRDLVYAGHERYLLPLVPAWIWLLSEALDQWYTVHRWRDASLALVLAAFAVLQGYRIGEAVLWHARQPPTLQQTSAWLAARCPRSQCLAWAEDFWDYWALRFYSRDGYDLNVWGPNWRGGPAFARNGRELAGCWHADSARPYRGRFRERAEFFGKGSASISVVCFTGVDEVTFP